jgi:WD40 repeat protein
MMLGLMSGTALAVEQLPKSTPQIVVDADGITGTPAQTLAISDDGRWLAAAAEKVVRIWSLHDNTLVYTLRGYQEPYGYRVGYVNVATFSPDSRFLAIGVTDNTESGSTRIYDLSQGCRFHNLLKGHLGCTRGIAFSPSGRFIATWGCDGQIIVSEWDAQQGSSTIVGRTVWDDQKVPQRPLTLGGCFGFVDDETLVYSHCGSNRVVSVSRNQFGSGSQVRLVHESDWPTTIKSLADLPNFLQGPFPGTTTSSPATFVDLQAVADVNGMWFAGGGFTRSTSEAGKFWSAVWNRYGVPAAVHEHDFDVVAVTFNRRAGLGASSDRLGEIHVWKLADGRSILPPLQPKTKKLWRVAWANDALLFSDEHYGAGLYAYNRRGPINKKLDLVQMAITPASVTVPDEAVPPVARLGDGRTVSFVAHSDGKSSHRDLYLKVDGEEHNLTNVMEQSERTDVRLRQLPVVLDVDWPPDPWSFQFVDYPGAPSAALRCVVGLENGELWECSIVEQSPNRFALKVDRKFLAHSGAITSISVSPDRSMLATSSLDGTIRVWRLKPPRVLGDLDCLTDGTLIIRSGTPELPKDGVIQRFDKYTYFERIKPIYSGEFSPFQTVDVQVLTTEEKHRRIAAQAGQEAPFAAFEPGPTRRVTLQPAPDLAEPLLNVYLSADNEWVVWNQQGFYNSSSQGARHVGFHTNRERHLPADFYPVAQFRGSFYYPKVVLETLRTKGDLVLPVPAFPVVSLDPVPPRIGGTTQIRSIESLPSTPLPLRVREESISDFLPPVIRIISPNDDAVLPDGTCHVQFEVRTPSGRRIKEVLLKVNQAVGPQPRETLRETENGFDVVHYDADLKLERGRHTLEVTASHDRSEASTPKIRVQSAAPLGGMDSEKPNLFVLAIGVSDYKNESLALQFASEDARDFTRTMGAQDGGRYFGRALVKPIVNKEATGERILDGLEWLASNCIRRQDLGIILVSGHGFVDDRDEWFFAPTDVDTAKLLRTGVSKSDFDKYLGRIPQCLMCVDTCRRLTAVLPGGVKAVGVRGTNPFRGSSHGVFFACAPGCVSIESAVVGHGMFTKAVIDAISSKSDRNGDGLLQFGELRAAVTENVRMLTGDKQTPIVETPEGFDSVVIASVPAP